MSTQSEEGGDKPLVDGWYKDAVIYTLDVETFQDGNGDGVGDFEGLTQRLDYLEWLGVTCLWLLPFYPSPNRDDGYDVVDHCAIDPRLGDVDDFRRFVAAARTRGIAVIVDLVVNHTSIDHPWFQAARSDPASPYRDYYVWSETEPERLADNVVFPGEQDRNWTYDEAADAYYFHRFYSWEPDLNTANTAVREEIRKIVEFWLDLGVVGFRVDAVPFLIEEIANRPSHLGDGHVFLRDLHRVIHQRNSGAMMLAEADHSPELVRRFFGHGDEMTLILNFVLNDELFLAFAREEAGPARHGLDILPAIPAQCGWANFLRTHDELNLGGLSETDREEVFARFSPDPATRIYGRGIRSRLASEFGGDRRRILLAQSLLCALPGTPVIYYGEEIGMGDDPALHGRLSVRTPMQWSGGLNAGFSEGQPASLSRPVVTGGPLGYEQVNVERERADPDSLLQQVRSLVKARRRCAEIGRGSWRVLDAHDPAVLAILCTDGDRSLLSIHNLSRRDCVAQLDLDAVELGSAEVVVSDEDDVGQRLRLDRVALRPYGYRWLRSAGN